MYSTWPLGKQVSVLSGKHQATEPCRGCPQPSNSGLAVLGNGLLELSLLSSVCPLTYAAHTPPSVMPPLSPSLIPQDSPGVTLDEFSVAYKLPLCLLTSASMLYLHMPTSFRVSCSEGTHHILVISVTLWSTHFCLIHSSSLAKPHVSHLQREISVKRFYDSQGSFLQVTFHIWKFLGAGV